MRVEPRVAGEFALHMRLDEADRFDPARHGDGHAVEDDAPRGRGDGLQPEAQKRETVTPAEATGIPAMSEARRATLPPVEASG